MRIEEEKKLVDRILKDDLNAFDELVIEYQRLVWHIVARMVSDPTDRQDLCQDIFLKIFKSLRTFHFRSKLSTWVGRIAYHTSINYLQKKKLPSMSDVTIDESHYRVVAESDDIGPEEWTARRDLSSIVEKMISKLTPIQKTLITLFHVENMSYSEMSAVVELPEGTIKSHLYRGRQRLKEMMKSLEREEIGYE
ncbi:sigma-70 family RNA polymerase sigma factor [candidate division KSB1 bacterium]|nr:sigma-70 family RNA polymerase sigma factor [candidate division KSB1 bacterium]